MVILPGQEMAWPVCKGSAKSGIDYVSHPVIVGELLACPSKYLKTSAYLDEVGGPRSF